MPIAAEIVESILIDNGFVHKHETDKIIRYWSDVVDQSLYINKTAGEKYSTIIIHPQYEPERDLFLSISGVNSSDTRYHSSNIDQFPKRINRGKTPISYGVPFGFDNNESCKKFILKLVRKSEVVHLSPIEDIKNQQESLSGLSETERDAVVKSRIGQGVFRELLIQFWRGCAITGLEYMPILKASHIKPWRDSSNFERLDPDNGLLLTPNFDALFDRGSISFNELGEILISKELDELLQKSLGLHNGIKLRAVSEGNKKYLSYHRENVFSH